MIEIASKAGLTDHHSHPALSQERRSREFLTDLEVGSPGFSFLEVDRLGFSCQLVLAGLALVPLPLIDAALNTCRSRGTPLPFVASLPPGEPLSLTWPGAKESPGFLL